MEDRQLIACSENKFSSALQHVLEPLFEHYAKRALSVHAGRNRITLVMPRGYVVKLPRNAAGSYDNQHEANASRQAREREGNESTLARARVARYDGLFIGFMELVKPINIHTFEGDVPLWAFNLDCGQAGLNKSGKLVAYDFGLN